MASLVLSVGAAWLAVGEVQWHMVMQTLARANGGWLLAALVSLILTTWLKAVRWRALFVPRPTGVSLGHLFTAMVFGQMLNLSLPMRAGDVGRAGVVGRLGLDPVMVLVTVAAEKWIDLVAAAVLALSLLPFMAWPEWARSPLSIIGAVVIVGLVGLTGLMGFRPMLIHLVQLLEQRNGPPLLARGLQWLRRAWQGLAALRTPNAALSVAGWSVLIWGLSMVTNGLVGYALGLPGTIVMWGFVLVVLQVGVAVPSSPARIGVFELLAMLALSPFGVPEDVALAYAVLLHVLVMGPIIVGGLALWPFVARMGTCRT